MGGVLVLAAGVPAALKEAGFGAVTIGYVLMRLAMLAQWLRAARNDPARRATALRYAAGTAVVQVGWLVRLALPETAGLGACWPRAARSRPRWLRGSPWTPCWSPAGLVLLFSCWWLYFLVPAGEGLARHRERSFRWGYGHYGVFAALAALGAGLEVVAESLAHPIAAAPLVMGFAVAIPVVAFLLLVWVLHAPLEAAPTAKLGYVLAAGVALAAIAAGAAAGLPLPWAVVVMSVPVWAVVALRVAGDNRHTGRQAAAA